MECEGIQCISFISPVQSLHDYNLSSPLITITSVESLPTRYKLFSLGIVLTHYWLVFCPYGAAITDFVLQG